MYSKIIIVFSILAVVSDVKSLADISSFSQLSSIFDEVSNIGTPSDGSSSNPGPASGCVGRSDNCIYFKFCNLTQQIYKALGMSSLTDPILNGTLPCAQGNGSGQLAFDPTTRNLILNLNIDNLSAYPRNTDGYCNCTVCNESCGGVFTNRCNNTETSQSQKFQISVPPTTTPILAGTGAFCASSSTATKCIVLIFCNVKYDYLGTGMEAGHPLFFCGEGELNISTDNNALTVGLSNFQFTMPSPNENCPCTACAGACADNPLLGCPNNNTHFQRCEKYSSTTEEQNCEK